MGLSRRVLADGEEVVAEGRLHWIALGRPAAAVVAAVAVLVAVVVLLPSAPVAVAEGLAAVVAVVALWALGHLLRWRSTVVAVTTLRLVERSGVLTRRGEEIRLDRIAELSTRQSLLGMALGFGTLVVDLGAGGRAVLHPVRRPARLQAVVTDRITAYQQALAGGGWGPGWAAAGRWDETPAPAWDGDPASRWDEAPAVAWDGDPASRWDEAPTAVGGDVAPGRWDDGGAGGWAGAPPAGGGHDGGGRWADAVPQWDDQDAGSRGAGGRGAGDGGAGAWAADGGWVTPPAGTPAVPGSVGDRLATLHRLYQQGLVTGAEYAAKRAQLLDQL